MSGEDGGLPDSPAAAVRARRESRTPIPEWLREASREDDSDEEFEPEEEEQYDSDLDANKDDDRVPRGRVRLHGAAKLPSGLHRDQVLTLKRSRAYKGCCWNGRAGVSTC